jgi:broad specificity phosphatase PhoE
MSKTARWTFIRHAPVIAKGLLYGASDVPADCSDQAAFAALAGNLPTDAVWLSSHLSRAQDTLKAIIRSGPAEALHGADAFVIDRAFRGARFWHVGGRKLRGFAARTSDRLSAVLARSGQCHATRRRKFCSGC